MTQDILPQSCSLPSDAERAKAIEAVQSDTNLTPAEKEWSVTFSKEVEYATVHSEIASTVRDLLAHRHFGIETVRVSDDERFGKSLSWQQWQTDRGPITGVKGYGPIGVLKYLGVPRSENYPGSVVSDYDPDDNGGDSP